MSINQKPLDFEMPLKTLSNQLHTNLPVTLSNCDSSAVASTNSKLCSSIVFLLLTIWLIACKLQIFL